MAIARQFARAGACVLLVGCLQPAATAAPRAVETVDFHFAHNTFRYRYATLLTAPYDGVAAVLTDFERLHRLNDGIQASAVLEHYADGSVKRRLDVRQCVLMFCFDVVLVERVSVAPGRIEADIVPDEGSFEHGHMVWHYAARDPRHTRITFSAEQKLAFWIPPVIGPYILKRTFLAEVRATCARLEALARGGASAP